jgi:urea carboxylase
LFGRTIQMWNTWRQTEVFRHGKPWLLDFFDQIRFFPVSHEELTEARAAFPHGAYPLHIEETEFSYAAYLADIQAARSEIAHFKSGQQVAFDQERHRWKDAGLDRFEEPAASESAVAAAIPAGCVAVPSLVAGNLWKLLAEAGQRVAQGDTLAIVESMKMEFSVVAPVTGLVRSVVADAGMTVRGGDPILVLQPD